MDVKDALRVLVEMGFDIVHRHTHFYKSKKKKKDVYVILPFNKNSYVLSLEEKVFDKIEDGIQEFLNEYNSK